MESIIQKSSQELYFLKRATKNSWELYRNPWVGIVLTATITRLENYVVQNILSPMEEEHVQTLMKDYRTMLNLYIKAKA